MGELNTFPAIVYNGASFRAPSSDGTNGQAFTTDGSGGMSFADIPSSLTGLDEWDSGNSELSVPGSLVVRQAGGTAGVDEVVIQHDGTNAAILPTSGDLVIAGDPAGKQLFTSLSGNIARLGFRQSPASATGAYVELQQDVAVLGSRLGTNFRAAAQPFVIETGTFVTAWYQGVLWQYTPVASDPSPWGTRAALYSKTVSGADEWFVMDGSGNVTQISPHNEQGEWVYESRNVNTGRRLTVDMERLVKAVDDLLGGGYVHEEIET